MNVQAGIKENEFFEYFGDREKGFAIEISELKLFEYPVDPNELKPDFVPPQSFYYVEEGFIDEDFKSILI